MKRYLCSSKSLLERGRGFSFKVHKDGEVWPAFAIRYDGEVKGYLNVCTHEGKELERGSGYFFSRDGQHLVCTSHGAFFEPTTGLSSRGPCAGMSLKHLLVSEKNGGIYLVDKYYEYYA